MPNPSNNPLLLKWCKGIDKNESPFVEYIFY